jgi:hypothetical protein
MLISHTANHILLTPRALAVKLCSVLIKASIKAMQILLQKVNNESPVACLTVKDAPAILFVAKPYKPGSDRPCYGLYVRVAN